MSADSIRVPPKLRAPLESGLEEERMSITLIAVVVALVLGHIAPVQVRYASVPLVCAPAALVDQQFPSDGFCGAVTASRWRIVPPVLLAGLLHELHRRCWARFGLLFAIVVLVYVSGTTRPRCRCRGGHRCASNPARGGRDWCGASRGRTRGGRWSRAVEAVFLNALRRWVRPQF